MNCYLCQVETVGLLRSACGVCQQCGVGICERHLVMIQFPVGMAGGGKRTLVCSSCACPGEHLHAPKRRSVSPRHQKEQASSTRWTWFHRRRQPSTLPEPAQVVVAVEQFLKQQRE